MLIVISGADFGSGLLFRMLGPGGSVAKAKAAKVSYTVSLETTEKGTTYHNQVDPQKLHSGQY